MLLFPFSNPCAPKIQNAQNNEELAKQTRADKLKIEALLRGPTVPEAAKHEWEQIKDSTCTHNMQSECAAFLIPPLSTLCPYYSVLIPPPSTLCPYYSVLIPPPSVLFLSPSFILAPLFFLFNLLPPA